MPIYFSNANQKIVLQTHVYVVKDTDVLISVHPSNVQTDKSAEISEWNPASW